MSHESDSASRHRNMLKSLRLDVPHVGASMPAIGFVRQPQSGQSMRVELGHPSERRTRMTGRAWIVALIALAAACSSSRSSTPQRVCRARFKQVQLATNDTVRGVAGVGPRPISFPPPRLGNYGPTAPVTLCLVPGAGADYDAVAITPDGQTHVVWTQNVGTRFTPPT